MLEALNRQMTHTTQELTSIEALLTGTTIGAEAAPGLTSSRVREFKGSEFKSAQLQAPAE